MSSGGIEQNPQAYAWNTIPKIEKDNGRECNENRAKSIKAW